jgi:hypothetical protein
VVGLYHYRAVTRPTVVAALCDAVHAGEAEREVAPALSPDELGLWNPSVEADDPTRA